MLAYSSIAHVGYLLIGLAANSKEGLAALIFYLIVYGFMNLGAFTAAILIENEIGTDNIDELSGLVRKRPWVATGLAICLLNLAGLPVPPAGFLAKVFIFYAGVQMYSTLGYWLVGVALLTSVPAVFYYSRVVIMMFVREPGERVASLPDRRRVLATQPQGGLVFALALSLIGIVVATINVMPLMNFSTEAVTSLGQSPTVGTLPREVH
jgi:NAD(P)H-quinone oxidoreductase subunit 2